MPLGSGEQGGYGGDGFSQVTGVVFDPTTNRLYVQVGAVIANQYEAWPEMYVFQVGAPSVPTTPGGPVVVSDGSPGFSTTGPGWSASPDGYLGESMKVTNAASGAATATWTASGLASGWYTLSVDWNGAPNSDTTAAVYRIYDGTTLVQTVTVNPQQTPSGEAHGGPLFQDLATVDVTSGDLTVVLSSTASGDLDADALWIDPASNPAS